MLISLVLGVLGNATSMLAYASPMPTLWRIVRRRSVQEFKEQPYMCSVLNGLLWVYYGAIKTKPDVMIISVNATGCAFHYIYLAIFWAFACKPKKVKMMFWMGCIHIGVACIVVALELVLGNIFKNVGLDASHRIRIFVAGIIASIAAVLMFGSPLGVMGLVIRTKSVEYMPFLLSLSFFLRSGTWAAYGFVIEDIFVEIPNSIGVFLAISQLVLYAWYKTNLVFKPPSKEAGTGIGMESSNDMECGTIKTSINADAIEYNSHTTSPKKTSIVTPSIEDHTMETSNNF